MNWNTVIHFLAQAFENDLRLARDRFRVTGFAGRTGAGAVRARRKQPKKPTNAMIAPQGPQLKG